MARRTFSLQPNANRKTAQRRQRPIVNGSQIIILVAVGVVGALLLFVLTGAAASRHERSQRSIIESSQAGPHTGCCAGRARRDRQSHVSTDRRPTDSKRPTGPYVGIVAGHWGNDSGAVCPDGVTEQQTNLEIAKRVAERLARARCVG